MWRWESSGFELIFELVLINYVVFVLVVTCPKLEVPLNGFFSSDCTNVYNAACGIICKPGYQLRGTSIRICKENATWDGVETKCIGIHILWINLFNI
jgi:hypothetical protein